MAYKEPTGIRKPMTPEAKERIAQAMRDSAARKRDILGLPPINQNPALGEKSDFPFVAKTLELVRMKDQSFSDDLFVPMSTGKPVDMLFTNQGGIPKACNFMLIGDPGVGKSTVSLDILSDISLAGFKVLFICAEMTRIDLYGYVKRYPKFGEVQILFTGEYCDSNPKSIIEEALAPGYDVVLIDSFAEIQSDVKEALSMSSAGSEKWLIDLMISHNLGGNKSSRNTTFIAIQQVTKGGCFVGSNKLKHNTTGMLELRNDTDSGTTFMLFTKNRRGSVGKRMFYSLSQSGDVQYDLKRFSHDENARESLAQERSQIDNEESQFDDLFGLISQNSSAQAFEAVNQVDI